MYWTKSTNVTDVSKNKSETIILLKPFETDENRVLNTENSFNGGVEMSDSE